MSLTSLKLVSYLAPNMFWFYQEVTDYLSQVLGREIQLIQSQYDPLNDPMLLQDRLDIAFICGLPFIRYYQKFPDQLQAIAAPVMAGSRYQNRPIYFSDIVVKKDSNFQTFNDLAGKTFCYNDLGSNSGYNLLCHRLIKSSYSRHFFGNAIQSHSHQRSLQFICEGIADCAAIDSTVLEQELRDHPNLSHQLRILESSEPCPIPPVIVSQHLSVEVINTVKTALLNPDLQLKSAMNRGKIQRYERVKSEDYTSIGRMYDQAIALGYQTLEPNPN